MHRFGTNAKKSGCSYYRGQVKTGFLYHWILDSDLDFSDLLEHSSLFGVII